MTPGLTEIVVILAGLIIVVVLITLVVVGTLKLIKRK